MDQSLKKIALIGPESTGKTTLCLQLAEYFHTCWVPEFARAYIGALNRKYILEDIEYCSRQQLQSEEDLAADANRFLFCDTELIVAKVWCEDLFQTSPSSPSLNVQRSMAWMESMIDNHRYDLFLLTLPDIPFQQDDVRENPHRREFFFDWYKRELDKRNFNYEIIGGIGEQRLLNSLQAIRKHFPDL